MKIEGCVCGGGGVFSRQEMPNCQQIITNQEGGREHILLRTNQPCCPLGLRLLICRTEREIPIVLSSGLRDSVTAVLAN